MAGAVFIDCHTTSQPDSPGPNRTPLPLEGGPARTKKAIGAAPHGSANEEV